MKRLIEQAACLHGYFGDCTFKTDVGLDCPGGTSREVTGRLCETHGAPEAVSEEAGFCWIYNGDKTCVFGGGR